MGTLEWMDQAACKGADLAIFFPKAQGPASYAVAKSYCEVCPVIELCDQYAMDTMPTFGMWGGRTRRERKQGIARTRLKRKFGPGHGDMAGTTAGYWRHMKSGDKLCDPCRQAYNAAKRERERKQRAKERNGYSVAS